MQIDSEFLRQDDAAPPRCIVLAHQQLEPLEPALSQRFTIRRAWRPEEADPIELATARVLVVAGEATLDRTLVARLPKLGLIACASVGYDGIDVEWVRSQGLLLSHAQGVNDEDVADHALGCVILHRRSLLRGDAMIRSGGWAGAAGLRNRSLRDTRLGIVGLGRIGAALADRASALGLSVQWWGPRDRPSPWPRAASLEALAQGSDALVVAARADDTNVGLISSQIIGALGPDGLLVNVARGALLDEEAMIAALRCGQLGGAALDVFQQEPTTYDRWKDVPNLLLTPHIAGKTGQALARISDQLAANIDAFFDGRPLLTPLG